MDVTEPAVLCEVRDYVATVTLNRPDFQNVQSVETLQDLVATLGDLDERDDVRVIVITGAGRSFCAGVDLTAREDLPVHEIIQRRQDGPLAVHQTLLQFQKPTIAAVNGVAFGAGMEIALACDVRFAADTARMGLLDVRCGQVPSATSLQQLARSVGVARAKYMAMVAEIVDAPTAERLGLVQHVCPAADLLPTVLTAARKIADNPPLAVRQIKRCLDLSPDLWMTTEFDKEASTICLYLEDRAEADRAFEEKRKPEYTGR